MVVEKISFLFDNFSKYICEYLNLDIYLHRVIENNTTKFVKTQAFLKFND